MLNILNQQQPKVRNSVELADILREYLSVFLQTHKVHSHQFKVINSIVNCRTSRLGAHVDVCDHCHHLEISYNSCRDRHCPKCHGSKQAKWLANQIGQLLPVPYFHVVFTLPHLLNDLFICNQKRLYNHFFKAASATLNQFAADPKYLGGKIGHIGILHTWGQNLGYHVHLHFIVSGGALSADKTKWIQRRHSGKYLFPIKAMQAVFKGKFMELLIKDRAQGKLIYPGDLACMKHPVYFADFVDKLYKLEWVMYAKKPFAGPDQVLKYIGRYTHRVAISNHRIISANDDEICFTYKDYRDNGKRKVMRLTPVEFIRRYLQHILPCRFVKIRHGGFLAGGYKKNLLALAAELLKKVNSHYKIAKAKLDAVGEAIMKECIVFCPSCSIGQLRYQKEMTLQMFEFMEGIK